VAPSAVNVVEGDPLPTCKQNDLKTSFKSKARARWPAALSIWGDGPYATVSLCPPGTTVILCASREDAKKSKSNIDRFGCGAQCRAKHDVVELS
jgi:hypothetical protein